MVGADVRSHGSRRQGNDAGEDADGEFIPEFQGKLHDDTLRFLLLLAEKRRLADLAGIAAEFLALCREKQGVAEVRVVSAEPLAPEQLRHLLAKLTVRLGKQITATTAVDSSLLGGFRVHHGDQVIDASLVSQLDSFKLNVLAAF